MTLGQECNLTSSDIARIKISAIFFIINEEVCQHLSLALFFVPYSIPDRRDKSIRDKKPLITFLCLQIMTSHEICPSRQFMEDVQNAKPRAS
jgi:hypothetical protein